MRQKNWSNRELQQAITLSESGMSASQIGAVIGRTKNSVIGALSRAKPRKDGPAPFPGNPGHCKYPLWSGKQRTGKVCNKPGSPYCPECEAIVYRRSANRSGPA